MKLKEVQLLGILALLAVAVILLCVWGGETVPEDATLAEAGEQTPEPSETRTGVDDLLQELMAQSDPPARSVQPRVVQPTPPDAAGQESGSPALGVTTEESTIRDLINQMQPEEIRVTRAPTPSTDGSAPGAAQTTPQRPQHYVVERGDTLSGISQKLYGSSRHHGAILKANSGVLSDPRLLQPGMRLRIPPLEGSEGRAPAASSPSPVLAASSGRRTYKVEQGDSLWRIAEKCYGGDGMKYKDIQTANSRVLPDAASLQPGMVLVIP